MKLQISRHWNLKERFSSAKDNFKAFIGSRKGLSAEEQDAFENEKVSIETRLPNGYIVSKTSLYGKEEMRRIGKKLKKLDRDPVIALQKAALIPGFFGPVRKKII